MSEQKQPAEVGPVELVLGPLPEPDVSWVDGKDKWGYDDYSHAYSAEAMTAYAAQQVTAERERLCAAIKAADDKASEGDYMLDSDDCISVIRGAWNPGA